jgi:hydrophobic/amphiphilic exporter-1 (mainly G- bacteria), HAE1 family
MSQPQDNKSMNFNLRITKFFLENTRITAFALIALILAGAFTLLNLKTTGFPAPKVGISVVQTVYPGASSDVVLKDISIPLENAVKSIDGVSTYSTNSQNSFSLLNVTIKEGVNIDSVKDKIAAAVTATTLPKEAQKPVILNVDIGGPEYIFSISNNDKTVMYEKTSEFKKAVLDIEATKTIEAINEYNKEVIITFNDALLKESRIQISDIQSKIQLLDESLPVVSGVTIDSKSQSITTSIPGKDIESLKQLEFTSQIPQGVSTEQAQALGISQKTYKLSDLGTIEIGYNFDSKFPTFVSGKENGSPVVTNSVVLSVKTVENTDQAKYIEEVIKKIKDISSVEFVKAGKITSPEKTIIAEHYSVADSNTEQVAEVVKGLIGGPLDSDNFLVKNAGWVLGALQLVILVMIAFVSWRAAIVAAVSIPLSIAFATIYLYFIGSSLNTLVLFSLVLVIGLVVDPALVILEAIQRKIDTGMKGKEAVMAAVKDVGNGLFLATMVSAIVFVPFGVVSGILGQIFKYIPLTVIPAVIGSYIVPLVFLSWLGSLLLKRSKGKSESEEDNLWSSAKWLIRLNKTILRLNPFIRFVMVAIGLIIPIVITGYFFGTRQIKQVQFASSDNGQYIQVDGSFKPDISSEVRASSAKAIVSTIQKNENVMDIYPIDVGFGYYVNMKPVKERKQNTSNTSKTILESIPQEIKANFLNLTVDAISNGPPDSSYEVALSVKENNLEKLREGSLALSTIVKDACIKDGTVSLKKSDGCTPIVEKIDDGYTGKENRVIDLVFDRAVLENKSLTIPGAPATAYINQVIKKRFELNSEDKPKVLVNGEEVSVVFKNDISKPTTLDEIKAIELQSLSGSKVSLNDVATLKEAKPASSIRRVKGETINVVSVKLKEGNNDQAIAGLVTAEVEKYYKANDYKESKALGLKADSVVSYSQGGSAGFLKSFSELLTALILSIILVYLALSLFFNSFSLPLVIIYTIPLTFMGWVPALALLGGGQFGFLEIIGLIILVGLVVNVAIFLIDAARHKIDEGMDENEAISLASGLRLRPVILTKLVAVASLSPLILFAELYRTLAIVVVFGLLASGFISLITTPILFVFFRWLSRTWRKEHWIIKILFFPFFIVLIPYWTIRDLNHKQTA